MHFVLAAGICADELFAFLRVAAGSRGNPSIQTCAHIAFVTGKDDAPALIMDDRYRRPNRVARDLLDFHALRNPAALIERLYPHPLQVFRPGGCFILLDMDGRFFEILNTSDMVMVGMGNNQISNIIQLDLYM